MSPVLNDTLVWRGTWAAGVDYAEDDAVLDSPDLVYVCTAANTSDLTNRPPNADFWELVADTPAAEAYASVDDYLDRSDKLSSDDNAAIADDLLTGSRYIDMKVFGQGSANRFTHDSSPQARRFRPQYNIGCTLDVDDFVSISSIEIDVNRDGNYARLLTTNDYEALPFNALQGGEMRPYRQIELTEWGSYHIWIPRVRVRITGIWGWPAIPHPIRTGCVEIVRLVRLATPRATRTVTEFGAVVGMSRAASDIIDELVANYSRISF